MANTTELKYRAEYAQDGYMIDIDLIPTKEHPQSHYGIPILLVQRHTDRFGNTKGLSPLVGDILDGFTITALNGVVISDDCAMARRMLGLPPDDPHAIPENCDRYSGGLGYKTKVAQTSAPITWLVHPSEGIISQTDNIHYYRTWDSLLADIKANNQIIGNVSLGCWHNVPDDIRAKLIKAGYPLPYKTQAEQKAHDDKIEAEIMAELKAEHKMRSGGQAEDITLLSEIPVLIAPEHIKPLATRIKSVGYGCADDMSGLDIESALKKIGATTLYIAPALTKSEFAGSITGGDIQEFCYIYGNQKWYAYVANFSGVDSWAQEWWVSHERLTANVAIEAIEKCRKLLNAKQS